MRLRCYKVLMLAAMGLWLTQFAWAGVVEGRVSSRGPLTDLSNFVVYVEDIDVPLPAPKEPAVMDQKNLRFVPHVLVIQVGTTVEFPNSDPLSHNVFSISDAKRFNLGLYHRGAIRRIKFDKPGVVELLCNVHLEMSGYIVVLKNPYFFRTGTNGAYRIPGVPAGRHRLRLWHERLAAQELMVQVPEIGSVTVDFSIGG